METVNPAAHQERLVRIRSLMVANIFKYGTSMVDLPLNKCWLDVCHRVWGLGECEMPSPEEGTLAGELGCRRCSRWRPGWQSLDCAASGADVSDPLGGLDSYEWEGESRPQGGGHAGAGGVLDAWGSSQLKKTRGRGHRGSSARFLDWRGF